MPLAPLDNLVRGGSLKREVSVAREIDGLIRSGSARLAEAENPALAIESRFDLAYNAAQALALAALRWHGYRSKNRYPVFQTLVHTVSLPAEQWRVLDRAHRQRNFVEYEGRTDVDEATVEAVIRVARVVGDAVRMLGPPAR